MVFAQPEALNKKTAIEQGFIFFLCTLVPLSLELILNLKVAFEKQFCNSKGLKNDFFLDTPSSKAACGLKPSSLRSYAEVGKGCVRAGSGLGSPPRLASCFITSAIGGCPACMSASRSRICSDLQ